MESKAVFFFRGSTRQVESHRVMELFTAFGLGSFSALPQELRKRLSWENLTSKKSFFFGFVVFYK